MAKKKYRSGGGKGKKKKNDARGYATTAIASKPLEEKTTITKKKNTPEDDVLETAPNDDDESATTHDRRPVSSEHLVNPKEGEATAAAVSIPPRLYKKMELLYLQLTNVVGFTDEQVRDWIVPNAFMDNNKDGSSSSSSSTAQFPTLELDTALEWACRTMSPTDLPPLLTEVSLRGTTTSDTTYGGVEVLRSEDDYDDNEADWNNHTANYEEAENQQQKEQQTGPMSVPSPHEAYNEEPQDRADETTAEANNNDATCESEHDKNKAWILQQYGYEEDDEDDDVVAMDESNKSEAPEADEEMTREEKELQRVEQQVKELEASLKDEASNYMRSKAEIKQLKKELGQLNKQASKWRGKVAKIRSKNQERTSPPSSLDQSATGLSKTANDNSTGMSNSSDKIVNQADENDGNENDGDDVGDGEDDGGLFGMFDEEGAPEQVDTTGRDNNPYEAQAVPPPASDSSSPLDMENDPFAYCQGVGDASVIPKSWTGQTPKEILLDYCRKHGYKRPTFSHNKVGRISHSLSIRNKSHGDMVVELQHVFPPSTDVADATEYLATWALWKLASDQLPHLYRLFPPSLRDLWKSWLQQQADEKRQADQAVEAELERKVTELIHVLLLAKPKADGSTTVKSSTLSERKNFSDTNARDNEGAVKTTWQDADEGNDHRSVASPDDHISKTAAGARLQNEFERRMQSTVYSKMTNIRSKLPMHQYRDSLLSMIRNHPVSILRAETGAGKSTQCPQFVLEEAILNGRGDAVSILCTQPRRVAAISLADRVADELCEPGGAVGGLVGYQIRMETKRSVDTRLLFCTTGVVLRRLQDDPNLNGVTHVIVDEVHERQWQIDFLLIALRQLVQTNRPDLKVILMSATLDVQLFCNFFGSGTPFLKVPGRTFPVSNYFLEDLLDATNHIIEADSRHALRGVSSTFATETLWVTTKGGDKRREIASLDSQTDVIEVSGLYSGYKMSTQRSMDRVDEKVLNFDLIEDVLKILLIDKDTSTLAPPPMEASETAQIMENGAILIFLPGFGEIRAMVDRLEGSRIFGDRNKFDIIPLHSTLSAQDQKRAFRIPPRGCRKIILSTNIAETSVTISDVVAVIDSGLVREIRQDKRYATNKLMLDWCSRASAKQRSGRAGRVQSGICCKLFSSRTFEETMREQAIPELQRVPLEEVCLSVLAGKLSTSCRSFLLQAPQPPSDTSVNLAMTVLQQVGAVNIESEVESLTPLGVLLAKLPLHIRLGKMLIYGCVFGCLDKVLTIAASLSVKSPFNAALGHESDAKSKHRQYRHESSDFLTTCSLWEAFRPHLFQSRDHGRSYCRQNFLSWTAMIEIADSRRQFVDLLSQLELVPPSDRHGREKDFDVDHWLQSLPHACKYSSNENMIHAVVCAGLYPNVARLEHDIVSGIPKSMWHGKNEQLHFHSSSTNYKKRLPSPIDWIIFHEKFATSRWTSVSTTSVIRPTWILLFGGPMVIDYLNGKVIVDEWIDIPLAGQTAVWIRELRSMLNVTLSERLERGRAPDDTNTNSNGNSGKRFSIVMDILQLDSHEHFVKTLHDFCMDT